MIVRAAILRDGGVWSLPRPARHHDVLALMRQCGLAQIAPPREVQGFLRDDGQFLDRKQAAEEAVACGQIANRPSPDGHPRGYFNHPPDLFSEDLW